MPPVPKKNFLPLILTAVCILADQVTKYLVTVFIPPYRIGASFFGDFLRIVHVYNTGIAFSMGDSWAPAIRMIAFAVVPCVIILLLLVYAIRSSEITAFQRWLAAGICGGGIGNLIDRFFRKEGVVDFIDVKFYGLFGLERWPTFNIADSCVMVCGILLAISIFISTSRQTEEGKNEQKN